MKKEVIVVSLGGSLIIPDDVDYIFLKKLKTTILKHTNKYKFLIACGGGSIARKYISALRKFGKPEKLQSLSGISATRMNARFMSYFFGLDPKQGMPHTLSTLKSYLNKQDIVFIGALEYKPRQTSDSTAAEIARYLKTRFINLTDVDGLYTKNPKKHKDARFVSEISWKDFNKMAQSSKYQPGQHFVLDQSAAEIILRYKIPTYIFGKDLANLDNFLKGKKFKGTTIQG